MTCQSLFLILKALRISWVDMLGGVGWEEVSKSQYRDVHGQVVWLTGSSVFTVSFLSVTEESFIASGPFFPTSPDEMSCINKSSSLSLLYQLHILIIPHALRRGRFANLR